MRTNKKAATALLAALTIGVMSGVSANAGGNGSANTLDPHKPIQVNGGKITGKLSGDGQVAIFEGIPFAAPPVGNLRWKAPAPVVKWAGIREATDFGPSCWQTPQTPPILEWTKEFLIQLDGDGQDYSEDCLTLNVWTETGRGNDDRRSWARHAEDGRDSANPDRKRPVIVYIHGGGNTSGGSSCPVYDGEAIAKKGVVYVSVNYRVGIFGFFSHPALSAENKQGISGNYAYLDLIAALEWVKTNVSKFGGDPNNVTIAGQSAGAGNVGALVVSPLARGLFQNAVTMTGSSPPGSRDTYLQDQELANEALYPNTTLEQLRAIPGDQLWSMSYRGGTLVDGVVFPMGFADAYATGNINHVNYMTGNTEGDAHFRGTPSSLTGAQYTAFVNARFGSRASEVLALYPAPADPAGEAIDAYLEVTRDSMMAPSNAFAQVRASIGETPTYVFYWHHYMPPGDNETTTVLAGRIPGVPVTLPGTWGAFHTSEVPYFLNYFYPGRSFSNLDYQIGDDMSSYLVNFAKTGNPNGHGLTRWRGYNGGITFMDLGDTFTKVKLSAAKEAFWAETYGPFGNN